MNNYYAVIMAGGIGSRFWPISRADYPKQFLDIMGSGQTLIQQTVSRFREMVPIENIYVVTSDEYIDIVKAQVPSLLTENIIGEPLRRNTAPCIAYISFKLFKKDKDATMIVAPSDHLITDLAQFNEDCTLALNFAQDRQALVTLGIKPGYPSTGYGYIQKAQEEISPSVFPVKQFIEKPYLELAKTFVKSEDYLWNSGIFAWRATDILRAYEKHLPDMFNLFINAEHAYNTTEEHDSIIPVYQNCENISIDFGILEKSGNVYTIPSSFGWSDLGTWCSAWENMRKDYMFNAIAAKKAMMIDTANCIVHASPEKLILIQGLDDFIVADTKDVLLICRKEKEQEIKNYVKEVNKSMGNQFLHSYRKPVLEKDFMGQRDSAVPYP
ncbi:MAG: 2-C-methyl-D-erythritol 4-phosphate cytidylyltransferase [Chitinophagaceae bacterium]|nr:2-C-methyl-D-erythritol 4-phosphate cytidylyltransferase [Chitinophagaceae bacterium]